MAKPVQILSNKLMVVQKTDLRCVSSAWVLFIPRYISYSADILLAEVTTLQGSVVCRHCCLLSLPASPTWLLVPAGSYLSFCLWAAEHNSHPLHGQEGMGFAGLTGVSHVLPVLPCKLLSMTWREEAKCHPVSPTFIAVMMASLAE